MIIIPISSRRNRRARAVDDLLPAQDDHKVLLGSALYLARKRKDVKVCLGAPALLLVWWLLLCTCILFSIIKDRS